MLHGVAEHYIIFFHPDIPINRFQSFLFSGNSSQTADNTLALFFSSKVLSLSIMSCNCTPYAVFVGYGHINMKYLNNMVYFLKAEMNEKNYAHYMRRLKDKNQF